MDSMHATVGVVPSMSRKCTMCHAVQPLSNFWVSQCKCKECVKLQKRQKTAEKKKSRPVPTSKICSSCKVSKPLIEFSLRSQEIGRVSSMCKPCKSKKGSEWYSKKQASPTVDEFSDIEDEKSDGIPNVMEITYESLGDEKSNKICVKCNIAKPTDEFYPFSKASDGLQYWCKLCKAQYSQENPLLPSIAKPVAKTNEGDDLFRCKTCSKFSMAADMTINRFYCKNCKSERDHEYKELHKDEINLKRKAEYNENAEYQEEVKKKTKQYYETRRNDINSKRRLIYEQKRRNTRESREQSKRQREEEILKRRQLLTHRVCSNCIVDKPIEQFNWENKAKFIRMYKCAECCRTKKVENGSSQPVSDDAKTGVVIGIRTFVDQKECQRCHVLKDKSEFAWKNKTRGIYEPKCKPCNALYQKEKRAKKQTK